MQSLDDLLSLCQQNKLDEFYNCICSGKFRLSSNMELLFKNCCESEKFDFARVIFVENNPVHPEEIIRFAIRNNKMTIIDYLISEYNCSGYVLGSIFHEAFRNRGLNTLHHMISKYPNQTIKEDIFLEACHFGYFDLIQIIFPQLQNSSTKLINLAFDNFRRSEVAHNKSNIPIVLFLLEKGCTNYPSYFFDCRTLIHEISFVLMDHYINHITKRNFKNMYQGLRMACIGGIFKVFVRIWNELNASQHTFSSQDRVNLVNDAIFSDNSDILDILLHNFEIDVENCFQSAQKFKKLNILKLLSTHGYKIDSKMFDKLSDIVKLLNVGFDVNDLKHHNTKAIELILEMRNRKSVQVEKCVIPYLCMDIIRYAIFQYMEY